VLLAASGTIQDTTIHASRPLKGAILGDAGPGPVLGGGILARGARLVLLHNEVSGNRDIGIAFVNGSSGEVAENRILGNGNPGLCVLPGTTVSVRDTTLTGNRSDDPNACGGLATGAR
jgi:parallel beta-helix repeat protein